MMSEEVIFKDLSSSGNGAIPYADEDVTSGVVNAPPRLGRSRIFAKEELMYATNHNPQQYQQQQKISSNSNPNFRGPLPKVPGARNANPSAKSSMQERPDNSQRTTKHIASRRAPSKDAADIEDENPLQRYENALLRYRKPNPGGLGGLRKDRREVQNSSNNGYSSSDSECAIPRYNKSKSTSSIDTQSVNNILDEYEDLDYGRSSDLSDSGSISVTNFEAVMDQRKRQQQQQQYNHVERSNRPGTDENVGKEGEGQQHQQEKHHDQRARLQVERPELVFKVNQQTQVRQRSRDRQTSTRESSSNKLNSSSEEQPSRSKNDTSSVTTSDNRTPPIKQVPEVLLLRKGEVQKRVDEWLNQTQSQNFASSNGKRESGRIVALVRSSSSAEPKNSRRCRNDARSRSTDENSCDRLNGTASYDDINRTEATRTERKLDRTKNVAANATRGTYKDYLAVRNRSRHPTDYGFVRGSGRSSESSSGGSRIPQRGQLSSNVNSRRRQLVDENVEDRSAIPSASSVTVSATSVPAKQDKNSSRSARLIAVETRIAAGFVKTRPEQLSSSGPTVGTASTTVLANGRAASFKRARSHERNTGIAAGRGTGVLVKEDQQSGNARMRGGHQQQQQQQFISKGQLASGVDQTQQQATATSPNKVGESRRLLVAGRQSRVREDPIEGACSKSSEGSLLPQRRVETNEKVEDTVGQHKEEFTKFIIHRNPSCGSKEKEEEEAIRVIDNPIDTSGSPVGQALLRSPEESRMPRSRLVRENSDVLEQQPRRPPAPPRRDQSRRDKTEQTSTNDQQATDRPCSSFRPNKRMYSALRQLNEQNSFTGTCGDSQANANDLSIAKSHYAAPKKVEKIYERSTPQSRVIHSNDLESILKPVVRASAYGEASENETTTRFLKDSSTTSDNNDAGTAEEVARERTETIEENRMIDSPRNSRYPEIGLDQCRKIQRRHPSGKIVNKEISVEMRDLPIVHTKNSWDRDESIVNEPAKTFGTFQPGNTINCYSPGANEKIDKKISCRESEDIDEAAVVDVNDEPTYQELDLIPTIKISIANSYEARSTLRLDRNLGGCSRDSDNHKSEKIPCDVVRDEKSQIFNAQLDAHTSEHSGASNCAGSSADTKLSGGEETKSISREKCGEERGAVVNEVLVKNLRFQQDVPKLDSPLRLVGPIIASKPFNFNSVLSDDYEKIQAGDCGTKHAEETKIYVTKEEMERQKMMDLLRRGDYEAVKLGADRVCPSTTGGKHSSSGAGNGSRGASTPVTAAQDLPLESLWAAGLDDGMGFPQRCSYANHRTLPNNASSNQAHNANPEELWRDRNLSYRTPTTSTGIGSSITDEIWTSANDRKFFRTSTTSTGIGSSLNLQDNNRSLESRDDDFYPTDVEETKDGYRKYYPTTPTTSGLGSSSERQSVETQRSGDLPDHLWAAAMEDGFSRFNAMKSLQTITRQPRPNHDWVKTERISRFTKHRTISQSPQREQEIWTSRLNEINVSGYATQRIPQHRCHHQTRRSFSTSIVADLAGTPNTGSQQSLGSGEFLDLERSYTLSTPGGGSPVCCPPCSPPPAPAAYISSVRASSRRLATGNGLGGPTSPDRDPLGKLLRYLKTFYRELGTRDPRHLPPWASPLPLGTLCPAHFQPHLQLVHKSEQEHRLENIKIDQIFAPVRLSDGTISEAPRRVAVEGGPGSGRTTLCLRLLHHWATQGDGPALAFMVPLRELRGSQLLNYLARELFPRTSALGDAVAQVWRTLHLMEDRVLFVLDGYDECLGGRASLGDAADLLEGRLFPEARIFVTCSPTNSSTLSPLVQRRIHLAGLEWSHVERLCVAYFIHNDLAERACEFLEALNVQTTQVKQLVQHPLGWVMLCALYQDSGSLPTETSSLVQAAIKCIVRRSLDRPVPHDEEIPGHCRKRLEDFGKLSLAALREGRCCYTEAELRSRGGGIEVTRLGFLSRGLTFGQRRKADLYTPIHMSVAEFLAAYYLTSVAQYANILRRELEGLPSGIIGHLAGLLGSKTHLILNQLCPLEVPPRMVFSLLKAAGASDGNIAAVCRLVGAGPGFGPAPNDRPPAPLVQTSPLELEGWTRILESSACTLEALEVVFQVERGSDPSYLNEFFDALAGNESVKLVRITSLLGQEFPADEAQRLAGHLKCVLGKKRLNDFELVITCLEESAHDRLECVVNALCRGLGHASNNLARLVLDMNLSGDQVSRVCEALRDCVQVQALHLPHLSCGCEGLASVAELLKERPLLALNLAGSWGAKNEDPSSSGISMGSGSGSGSSGCASSTLGTLPLNRCYSSLPRGALAAYGSMTRPATLPRLPLGLGLGPNPATGNGPLPTNDRDRDSNSSSKRNSDSVLCHRLPLMHPLPTCDVTSHQGTGFHEIFNAIREPNCKLRSLNVSKCLQGGLDAGCLGETIRRARYLDALRASGASRPADVMPLVLALTEAPCLQLLDLASPRLALDDHPSRLLCHALARNCTLRLLSLEGWTFRIEESESLAVFSELLMCTSVRELSLSNARLHLAVHEGPLSRLGRRDDAGAELLRAAPPPACPTIVFLRLAGFQVTVNDRPALRGPLLLPFLAGFTALSELDLSLDKSEIGGSSSSLLFIDDKILQHFFGCLSSNFKSLQSLRINFWRISLEDSERTMRHISKNLKLCNLSFLKANGLIVTDSAKKVQMEHLFLQTILANLQNLTWLCLDGVKLTDTQASSVGKCIRDRYPGTSLEISAKDIHVKSIKALVAAIEDGGRAEVVYTGGSSCRLKITKIQKNGKGKKK